MSNALIHYLALPPLGAAKPRCDVAVGVRDDDVNKILRTLHAGLHERLLRGSFTDRDNTDITVDWDIAEPPKLSFTESGDGQRRLTEVIRRASPAMLEPDKQAAAFKGLRNLTFEIEVPKVMLEFSKQSMKRVKITLSAKLFAYATIADGKVRVVPFDVDVQLGDPLKMESKYEAFLQALIDMYLPSLALSRLTPLLDAAVRDHALVLPDVGDVSFRSPQLWFQRGFLVATTTMKGRRTPAPELDPATWPKDGAFTYASYELANTLVSKFVIPMLYPLAYHAGGSKFVFAYGLDTDLDIRELSLKAPADKQRYAARLHLDFAGGLHLFARALFIRVHIDGSVHSNAALEADLGLALEKTAGSAIGGWDAKLLVGSVGDINFSAEWDTSFPGLATLLKWLSTGLFALLDVASIFVNKLSVPVVKDRALAYAVPVEDTSFTASLLAPKVASAGTGILVSCGVGFEKTPPKGA